MDYIYWIFQHIFYDSNPTDSNEILLPNLPPISLEANKLKDEAYMSNMAEHVAEYVRFLTNHWPVRKSRLASESSSM